MTLDTIMTTEYSAQVEYEKPTGEIGTLTVSMSAETPNACLAEAIECVPEGGQPTRVGTWEGETDERPANPLIEYHEWIIRQYEELEGE